MVGFVVTVITRCLEILISNGNDEANVMVFARMDDRSDIDSRRSFQISSVVDFVRKFGKFRGQPHQSKSR